MSWYVYIIECKDGKLYTGITSNLRRRIQAHNSGNGCRFTKYRFPVTLLRTEEVATRSDALKREARIKKLPRKKKLELSMQGRKKSEKRRIHQFRRFSSHKIIT